MDRSILPRPCFWRGDFKPAVLNFKRGILAMTCSALAAPLLLNALCQEEAPAVRVSWLEMIGCCLMTW